MNDTYPTEPCPFCAIGAAFPSPSSSSSSSLSSSSSQQDGTVGLWRSTKEEVLRDAVPDEQEADFQRCNPSAFVVLRSRHVVAFLDILPMTGGHLLLTTRKHDVKVADMGVVESREIGFWLPILARTVAKVTGVTDYNIVQNNGARAAQVVPHVHFHIIPRPATMPEIKNKSWTMFGRGQRDDLDDEEGSRIAGEMRAVLREEVKRLGEREAKL